MRSYFIHLVRIILLAALSPCDLPAQQTVLYQDALHDFEHLVMEFEQGQYGSCLQSAERFMLTYHDPRYDQWMLDAELYALKSRLRMQEPGAIPAILAFAERHRPGAISQRAILLVGDDAYSLRRYDEAIEYLSMVDSRSLQPEERSGLYFKLGYCLFIRKEFQQAAPLFLEATQSRDKYYYPSHYYHGMTQYFMGQYDAAIRSFELVAPSDYYKDYVPYYIVQIRFHQKSFADVIGYGEQVLKSPTVSQKTEIHHRVGQAYFETGDFEAAIPHLEFVEKNSARLRTDDFYQLGIAYYQTGRYHEAIPMLYEIRNEPGRQAQFANYYLGRCFIEVGDKTSARNSLMKAAGMEDDLPLAYEATFHYGRLSAEAGDDVGAIKELQRIPSSSTFYMEAQQAMAEILTHTGDYALAVSELESMSTLSNPLKGAYQKVCLYRGEQLIQEGKHEDGMALLDKSLRYPMEKGIEARAYFWKGEYAHDRQLYKESIRFFDQYFEAITTATDVPIHQAHYVGHYNQGYNYLRSNDYPKAQQHFEECLTGIRNMPAASGQMAFIRHQIYPDAVLRTGDCAFKRNQYEVANQYYQEAIKHKYPGQDYAEYQAAIIKGLQQKPSEKVSLLESLVRGNPTSPWADDALFQIGNTLQEQNQISQSIAAYERLVNQYPKSTLLEPALLKLGLISYNAGRFDQALTYYQSVFTFNPSPETAREAMSAIQEIYVTEKDQPDKYFEFASTIPGFEVSGNEQDSIMYGAAEHHYAQGDYARAAESFSNYLKAYPNGFYALKARFLQAESYALVKRYDEALNAYEAVIKLGQSYYLPSALHKAALISYHQKQDMDRAFTYYQAYIPHAPDAELQYEAILGALRSAYKSQREDAVKALASQLVTHGRATEDHKALACYYRAKINYQQSNFENAHSDLNEVIRINSAELAAESRYLIADIYVRHGELVVASKLAEEAARANVGYPYWVAKSLILLSDIHFQQQDFLNARAILEAVIDNMEDEAEIRQEAQDRLAKVKAAEQNQSRLKPGSADTLELITPIKKD